MATNFCFQVPELQNDRVKIIPFDAQRHAEKFHEDTASADIWAHLASGPFDSTSDFVERFLEARSYSDPTMATFAIIDTTACKSATDDDQLITDGGELAGMVSLMSADKKKRVATIGGLVLLPAFRSRGIAVQACRLLLDYGLRPREDGGLGLIEMSFRVSTANEASRRVAIRLGLKTAGVSNYHDCLENGVARGKIGNGKPVPPNSAHTNVWRDIAIYRVNWVEFQRFEGVSDEEDEGVEEESDSAWGEAQNEDTDEDEDEEMLGSQDSSSDLGDTVRRGMSGIKLEPQQDC